MEYNVSRERRASALTVFVWDDKDDLAVNTARVLAADAVENVGNGHPGTAISLAPAAYLLFQKVMRHNPSDPSWAARDRFVLSCGHSSLTLYIQLFLAGYKLSLQDLRGLRQWGSLTPGHPEYGHTPGVEITTGPLGQGLASAVGFAYSARFQRGLFKTDIFDHYVYVIASEGDIEEGVTSEACSLAGLQQLGNLLVILDRNYISIEDNTDIALSEDIKSRYLSYGWQVIEVPWRRAGAEYREDVLSLYEALLEAQKDTDRPSLIILETVIAWPSPGKQNTGAAHGAALGVNEVKDLKRILGFDPEKTFEVPDGVLQHTKGALDRGQSQQDNWENVFSSWRQEHPIEAALFDRLQNGVTPDIDHVLPVFSSEKPISTRAASGQVINRIAEVMPELWGGSADLAESNNTTIKSANSFLPESVTVDHWKSDRYGRILHFGVREHAMAAIINGIVLHGNTRVFGGTFLVFSDYMRPAVRLAALMKIPSIFVWTHDSIGLGEDGPTHQPVEHLWALRAIPGLSVIRPADANEVAWAWKEILERRDGPVGLVLSRQNLPVLDRTCLAPASELRKGAYILADGSRYPRLILIATGSEVSLAIGAREVLENRGIPTRVVSAPCLEWFDQQEKSYRNHVLPPDVETRISVEAGLSLGWSKYIGDKGASVSIEHYGASAAGDVLFERFGFTVENIVKTADALLGGCGE
ncbi:MAG: transketolase [Tropheryma whipplei]|uniref:transketolase n=1 Tax=Tropheryma whipplei TaxID=2039 RepID=UPI000000C858|nr:transketolase [Tropheryma whipplei]MCO8182399.1 transketolase [Tropheryma whipplei]CAD67100.1 transketolase [Tropheryma whipplei TW08/27]